MKLELTCPGLEEMRAFVHGKSLAGDASRIRKHLDKCHPCRSLFDSLAAPNTETHANHPAAAPKMSLSDDDRQPTEDEFPFLLPPVLDDEIGRLGNYRVLRLLGQGGMGLVFLAEDIQLARPVALKVMRPDISGDSGGWKRFLFEARAMARIKHDHLVTIYQAAQENDVVFFAMELLEGESLDSWIRRETNPDVREIVRLAREIASGLAFLHEKKLIHRDIKPANIWVEAPRRRIKILDLGLVRSLGDDAHLTTTGIVIGTPEFMAPEQARGSAVDVRTDLFSLGGVLYYLCTRRKPFQGSSSVAVLMALASETPPPVSELNPRLPLALSDLIMQMLARDPVRRPESAAEVLERLETIEAGLTRQGAGRAAGTQVPDTQVVVPVGHTMTRPKRRFGLGCAIALGLTACLFLVVATVPIALWLLRDTLFPAQLDAKVVDAPPVGQVVFLNEMKDIQREHFPFKFGGPEGKEPKKKGPKGKKDEGGKDGKDAKDGPFGSFVRYKGQDRPRGIFMHPPTPPNEGEPTSLTYRLDKQFKTFEAEVSLRDGPEKSETPCIFWVFGDGKELWKSEPVSSQDDLQKCRVSVVGVDELKIAVTCAGPPMGAHASWLDPRLSK